jgi:hypothetical protein
MIKPVTVSPHLLPMPESQSLVESSVIKVKPRIKKAASLLPMPEIPSGFHPAVIELESRITIDMAAPNASAFPPNLVAETLHETYSKTYQNLDPACFKPTGNCAICGITFPSLSLPNVKLHAPIPSDDPTLRPYLQSLRWRDYNTTLSLAQLGFADYHGDSLLKGLVLDRRGVLAPTPDTAGRCLLTNCFRCVSALKSSNAPPQLALANNLWTGNAETFGLPVLTWMEQAVIAKARPTSCILKLKRDKHSALGNFEL